MPFQPGPMDVLMMDAASVYQAREWLQRLSAACSTCNPADELLSTLREPALTVMIVNQARTLAAQAFQSHGHISAAAGLECSSCCMYLYYSVLKRQVAAIVAAGTADNSRRLAISLLSMADHQAALLTLAAEVVFYGLLGASTFPAAMEQQGLMLRGPDVFEAVHLFLEHLRLPAEQGLALPDSVRVFLHFVQIRLVEELIWQKGSSMYACMLEGGGGCTPWGSMLLVERILRSLAALAAQRTRVACLAYMQTVPELQPTVSLPAFAMHVMDELLADNLDLIFGRHLSALVVCCVYGAIKARTPCKPSFKEVTSTVLAVCPHSDLAALDEVDMSDCKPEGQQASTSPGQVCRPLRAFYNQVFVGRMATVLHEPWPPAQQPSTDPTPAKQPTRAARVPMNALSASDLNQPRSVRFMANIQGL